MDHPILILAQSYPHVKNVLYLLDKYVDTGASITLLVFNNRYLYKYFSELNVEHFGSSVKLVFVPRYEPRFAVRLINYFSVFDRYYLYSSFQRHCREMKDYEIFFFSQAFTDYGYYYLRKLYRKNRITHIQDPGTDIYNITDGKPKGIRSFFSLLHMKMLYGRHIVFGDTGRKKFSTFFKISDKFYNMIVQRKIFKEERDDLQADFSLEKYTIQKYSKYQVIYFDKDVVRDGVAEEGKFQKAMDEIFEVISEYVPDDQIGRKYKPNRTTDHNRERINHGEIIPDHIPAEMLYSENVRVYLGITSIALANIETDNVVSLVHLIPFNDSIDMNGSIKNQEMRRKNNIIHYPRSMPELRNILDELISNIECH